MDSITPPFVSIHCDPEFFILGMEVEDLGGVGPPNPDFFKVSEPHPPPPHLLDLQLKAGVSQDEGTSRGRDLRAPMLGRGESVIEEWRRLVEYEVRGLSEGQVDPSQFRDALSRLLDKVLLNLLSPPQTLKWGGEILGENPRARSLSAHGVHLAPQANEACINLLREREELAVISRERELDAMAHAELIRLKLGQLNASYVSCPPPITPRPRIPQAMTRVAQALDREKMRLATTALQTAMEEVNEVTTQNR